LDKNGVCQQVFVPVQKADHLNRNLPAGLQHGEIHYFHCFNTLHRYLWPLKMLRIWQAFKKYFSGHPTPLIHAHTLIVNGLIAYRAHKKWGTPYIVTVRNTDLNVFMKNLPLLKPLILKVLENAAKILTISPAYRDKQLNFFFPQEKYPEIFEKCDVVPNGINDYWMEKRRAKENRQQISTLIFSGRIDKNKNLSALLNACKILTGEGFQLKLNVLGDGPFLALFRNKEYGFPVTFHGYLSDKEKILHLMRQSDVLVVPSFAESFGLVYPEAMSQGLPVIYTKNQGFDGYFQDGHVGFAVDPTSPHEIAEKIRLVFTDYDRLSTNAFNASKDFSWDIVSRKLIQLYQSIH